MIQVTLVVLTDVDLADITGPLKLRVLELEVEMPVVATVSHLNLALSCSVVFVLLTDDTIASVVWVAAFVNAACIAAPRCPFGLAIMTEI